MVRHKKNGLGKKYQLKETVMDFAMQIKPNEEENTV